jgi:hypothetical protein
MAINTTKTNVMVVSRRQRKTSIQLEGVTLEQVEDFTFLGSVKAASGDCKKEIKRRIGMSRQAVVKLDTIWKDTNISTGLKLRLMRALVWAIFLYGVESWTLKKDDQQRIASFEMWCWRRMLGVSWREHRTDQSVLDQLGLQRELLARVVKLKLAYFGHVARGSAGDLPLVVMDGDVEGQRYVGRPHRKWLDNIREWTGCTYHQCKTMAQDRQRWREQVGMWSSAVIQPRPARRT